MNVIPMVFARSALECAAFSLRFLIREHVCEKRREDAPHSKSNDKDTA